MNDMLYRLSISLAIGLMIGIERGWVARNEAEGERAAGLRTLALSGMLGGVAGALAKALQDGGMVIGLVFAVYALSIAALRYREMVHEKTFGATTVVAAYLAFCLGALAVIGDERVAAAVAVAATALLALKGALHGWLRRLTFEELRAGLILLVMTLILLPILPDRGMGPLQAINPHDLWIMTILIALVSAAGYAAIKLGSGDRGILISGLAGGLASSTAVTLSFAKLAREMPDKEPWFVGGAILASTMMVLRIGIIAGSINPAMLQWLLLPVVFAAAAGLVATLLVTRLGADDGTGHAPQLSNPFELGTVLKFSLFLAFIMLAQKVVTQSAGETGAYLLAVLSGLADVDAISLTFAREGGRGLPYDAAAGAILLAAAVNTLAKAGFAWAAGGRGPGSKLTGAAVLQLLAGGVGFLLTRAFDPLAAILPHLL